MYEFIKNIVTTITEIPSEQMEKFVAILHPRRINKSEHFISEGEIPKKFAFNNNGLFRYYYIDSKGNEFTKGFFPEGTFITSYSSMIEKSGSYYNIDALEDSDIFEIKVQKWDELFKQHECWKLLLIAMLEKGYTAKVKRERELLLLDAEARYRSFLENYPNLEDRIKQHVIASFLGITPVALSRIRKKMGVINIG